MAAAAMAAAEPSAHGEQRTVQQLRNALGRTGLFIAAGRALDTRRGDGALINDPYAAALAGPEGFEFFDSLCRHLGGHDRTSRVVAIRTKFFDNAALRCSQAADGSPSQVVLLGSGLDSRAYRLNWPANVTVFEVDFADVFAYKRAVLASLEHGALSPKCARMVEVHADLRDSSWADALLAAGFQPSQKSCWLLEGLLTYFKKAQVHRLLHTIAGLSSTGSQVVADVFNDATLTSAFTKHYVDAWARHSSPMMWSCNAPVPLFTTHGFDAKACRYGDDEANFGHYPRESEALLKNVAADSDVMPITRLVTAVRNGRSLDDVRALVEREIQLSEAEDMLEGLDVDSAEGGAIAGTLKEEVKKHEHALMSALSGGDDLD